MKRIGNILAVLVIGIMFVFKSYVIVIGQTKPVLVALNKAEANMAIVDPGDDGGGGEGSGGRRAA